MRSTTVPFAEAGLGAPTDIHGLPPLLFVLDSPHPQLASLLVLVVYLMARSRF